jgi:LacI family transcriptional regulator
VANRGVGPVSLPTIVDVANRAGVAAITVSRVVNDSGPVSLKVRARVEQAIAEIGYVPNSVARSLRNKRTDTIALVLTDMTNPYFTTVARGVEDAASDAGMMLIICNTDERDADEQRYVQMLLERRVDGIVLVPAGSGAVAIKQSRLHGTPLVVLDRRLRERVADVVRGDSKGGALDLGRLLIALGHRVTAVLTGPRAVSTADDRAAGFRQAMSEAGQTPPRVYRGAFTIESGREMAREAMAARPRPTALFAANNFIAIGVLQTLDDMNVRVPEDIAVVGFDDLPPAMVAFPFLTVAAQPAYEMGQRGVAMLLGRLGAGSTQRFHEVVLPTRLVVRRSSGDAIRDTHAPLPSPLARGSAPIARPGAPNDLA